MSSDEFDFEDLSEEEEDIVILDEEEEEEEKLENVGDIDDVDEDEFDLIDEDDENNEDDDIDIDILDIEEHIDKDEIKQNVNQITVPFITKYEYPKIISIRAQQIANGSPIFVDLDIKKYKNITAIDIAEMEFKQGKLNNIKIKRQLPNGKIEICKLSELKLYSFY